jgi:hypothetical protein
LLPLYKHLFDCDIEFTRKNYTLRQIAEKSHVSFSFVSIVRKSLTGETMNEEPQVPKQLSVPYRSFQLFEKGKTLVEVDVILDIPKDETIKIFLDYLALKNVNRVAAIPLLLYLK